jgi:radical SAM protein with 4Fe4S-binding SPASM domain
MIETIIWHVTARCNYDCRTCYASRFKGFDGTAGKIRDLGLFLYVSVDGVGTKHEFLRPKHSWNTLVRSLDTLNRFDIGFATITTLHKRNYMDIKEIIEHCKNSGAKFSCFLPLMLLGKTERDDILSTEEVLYSLDLLDEGANDFRYSLDLWCMPFAERFLSNPRIKITGCRNESTLDIDASGRVLLCDVLDVEVGDVKASSLSEVLKQVENHAATSEVVTPVSAAPCSDCSARSKCLGGCFARSFAECGRFDSPDPLCPAVGQGFMPCGNGE